MPHDLRSFWSSAPAFDYSNLIPQSWTPMPDSEYALWESARVDAFCKYGQRLREGASEEMARRGLVLGALPLLLWEHENAAGWESQRHLIARTSDLADYDRRSESVTAGIRLTRLPERLSARDHGGGEALQKLGEEIRERLARQHEREVARLGGEVAREERKRTAERRAGPDAQAWAADFATRMEAIGRDSNAAFAELESDWDHGDGKAAACDRLILVAKGAKYLAEREPDDTMREDLNAIVKAACAAAALHSEHTSANLNEWRRQKMEIDAARARIEKRQERLTVTAAAQAGAEIVPDAARAGHGKSRPAGRTARRRGAPQKSAKDEGRIIAAWQSGQFPSYVACARELKIEEAELRRIVDRHRKRQERSELSDGQ